MGTQIIRDEPHIGTPTHQDHQGALRLSGFDTPDDFTKQVVEYTLGSGIALVLIGYAGRLAFAERIDAHIDVSFLLSGAIELVGTVFAVSFVINLPDGVGLY